jgi:hypothetical protein
VSNISAKKYNSISYYNCFGSIMFHLVLHSSLRWILTGTLTLINLLKGHSIKTSGRSKDIFIGQRKFRKEWEIVRPTKILFKHRHKVSKQWQYIEYREIWQIVGIRSNFFLNEKISNVKSDSFPLCDGYPRFE